MKINIQDVMRGIAIIEKATNHPMAKPLLMKVLPQLGVTEDEMTQLEGNHQDYQRWLADAERRTGGA